MIATSASSYVDSSSEECFPSYAVDGLWWVNQFDPFSCNILSTQDEKHPWFALDLLTEKMVTGVTLSEYHQHSYSQSLFQIVLQNRHGCCWGRLANATVRVGHKPPPLPQTYRQEM